VAHRRFHAWQVDAAGHEQRAVGVTEVVKAKWLEPSSVTRALEAAAES